MRTIADAILIIVLLYAAAISLGAACRVVSQHWQCVTPCCWLH